MTVHCLEYVAPVKKPECIRENTRSRERGQTEFFFVEEGGGLFEEQTRKGTQLKETKQENTIAKLIAENAWGFACLRHVYQIKRLRRFHTESNLLSEESADDAEEPSSGFVEQKDIEVLPRNRCASLGCEAVGSVFWRKSCPLFSGQRDELDEQSDQSTRWVPSNGCSTSYTR